MEVLIDYEPRSHQWAFHEDAARFRVVVWHRRAGKTVACVNELIKLAFTCDKPKPQVAYICPQYKQASRIAWPYFETFLKEIPGVRFNKSDLRVDLPNEGKIYVLGSENADALRGMYLDACVIDETAQVSPRAWSEVLRPALADREGCAIFIGTPQGRVNLFFELYDAAEGMDDWSRTLLTADDTYALSKAEMVSLKREMSPEEFQQELYCNWSAAIRGAYYAKEMDLCDRETRITSVEYDRSLPVVTAWDLGYSDLTVVWHAQLVGTEVRLIDCDAFQYASLPTVVSNLREKPWPVEIALLPHDANVRELGTGKRRVDVLSSLGLRCNVLAATKDVHEGIDQARRMLAHCWFDRERCRVGIEALNGYRSEYDDVRRAHKTTPLHDWTSHYADAFRYLAVGRPQPQFMLNKPLDYGSVDSAKV